MDNNINKENLFGRVIESITGLEEESDKVTITFKHGGSITQFHEEDCCESVYVSQVDGNVRKHEGAVIHELIEKVLDKTEIPSDELPKYTDTSLTATFYTLKTSKGYLDWRWYGESNGYYSEGVDCILN